MSDDFLDEDNDSVVVSQEWLDKIRSYRVNYDEDYTGLP